MKKYKVTLYYHTNVTVEVWAENEEEAIEHAYGKVTDKQYDEQVLSNCQEDDDPDVIEITE